MAQGTQAAAAKTRGGRVLLRDVLLGAAVYFLSARLGLLFAIFHGGVSAVWPPSGLALGLSLVLGPAAAIGAGIGAALSDGVTHGLSWVSPLFGVGAALECLIGARLLGWRRFEPRMPRVQDVLTLVVFGAIAAPVVAATIGAFSLRLLNPFPADALPQVWRTWWVGDALGVLSFTPVLLAFLDVAELPPAKPARHEIFTASGLLLLSAVGVFLLPQSEWLASGMLVFAAVPLLAIVWVALRFDQRAAATAMLFLAVTAIVGTAAERGAFGRQPLADRVWLLQMYLVLCALTTFTIAALVADGRARHKLLFEQEEQLRRTSQLARVGGFSWGLAETVPRWSPQLHQIFRIPEGEPPLSLKAAVSMMLPEDAVRYQAVRDRVREAPAPYSFSFSFRRRDGEIRHAQAVAEPLFDAQRKLVRWDGAVQDITERVEAENQLRAMERGLQQSQRLESLGLLAGGVAHDFNNLLTGILANADFVKSELQDKPQLAQPIADIETAGRAAAELCKQMLTFAGRARPALEPLQLSKLVAETSQLLARSIKPGARIIPELAGELPAIDGDSSQLRQVAMNLLMNASDALGEEGTVVIRTELKRASLADLSSALTQVDLAGRSCVVLTVSDDGCGMSEETRARIFQPFFTTKAKGRGLGLAATLGIVQQHGGALVVESAPGKGTRFSLWFPVAEEAKSSPRGPFHMQGTALVADGDPAIVRVTVRLLEAAGMSVRIAASFDDVDAALSRASDLSFALVGENFGSSLQSGVELIRALRRQRAGLPCVLLVTADDDPRARALVAEGHASFLFKPFRPETLREAVQAASAEL